MLKNAITNEISNKFIFYNSEVTLKISVSICSLW